MKLKELLKIIQGTAIQKEALIKNYIGSSVEIHTDITNIESNKIDVWWFNFQYGTTDYNNSYIDTDNIAINIQYENGKFGTELLSYSRGDRVVIIAKLRRAEFSGYFNSYEFELVSIRKISSGQERYKAEKEDEETKRKKSSGCFIATACYGDYDAPEVLVLRQFRDSRLLTKLIGKFFVATYYATSPFFATALSKSDKLKKIVRQYLLQPIVTILQRQNKN